MEHQQWNNTVLSKKIVTPVTKKIQSTPIVPETQALDLDKKVEWFTPSMGKRVASLRAEQHMTQEQLAKKMGVTKKVITDIEYGNKERYQGAIVTKLKKALGNFSW